MATTFERIAAASVGAINVDPYGIHIQGLWALGGDGEGITVGIVDTGVDMTDPSIRAAVVGGINMVPGMGAADYQDRDNHGAICARIIQAIAPKATIKVVKIFHGEDSVPDERAQDGLLWSAEHTDITNASIGTPDAHPGIIAAVERFRVLDKSIVAAAGNNGDGVPQTYELSYPAACEHTICVGAWDRSALADPAMMFLPERAAGYSNSNPYVDFIALGRVPGSWDQGTSFAGPVKTAILACYMSLRKRKGQPLTDASNYQFLTDHSRQFPGFPVRNEQTGWGTVDLRAYNPERRLEIDVENLTATLDGQAVDVGLLENRAPGGLYGWFRPLLEAVGEPVEYDEYRRKAVYRL